MTQKTETILLGFIILFAIGLKGFYFVDMQSNPLTDFTANTPKFDQERFVRLAKEFIHRNWLGEKYQTFSPIYSYFLAVIFKIFGENLNYVLGFQMVLGVLAIAVFYKTAKLLFQNVWVGLVAASLAAFYGPFLYYEGLIKRDILIAYSFLFGLYSLLRGLNSHQALYFFLAGLSIGFATILRPHILPMFLVIYLMWGVPRDFQFPKKFNGLFILGLLIMILPLAIRNNALGRNDILSSPDPEIFWIGNTYDASGIDYVILDSTKRLSQETQGRVLKTFQVLLREIKLHPRSYGELYLRKIKMFFNGYEIPGNVNFQLYRELNKSLRWVLFDFKIICPLALLGLILAYKKFPHISLLYLFLISLSLNILVFHIQSRYRIVVVPFFLLFASYTLYSFYQFLKQREFLKFIQLFLLLGFMFLLTKPDESFIAKYFKGSIRLLDYVNLSNAYIHSYKWNQGKLTLKQRDVLFSQAVFYLNKVSMNPNKKLVAGSHDVITLLNQGIVHYNLGQSEKAKSVFQNILSLEPPNETAEFYLKLMRHDEQNF